MSYPSTNPQLSGLQVLADSDAGAKSRFLSTVKKALEKSRGDIKHAASDLNVGRTTLDRWICKFPELMAVLVEERKKKARGR